jgi:hypothetical protein
VIYVVLVLFGGFASWLTLHEVRLARRLTKMRKEFEEEIHARLP